jgi:hypothetical protein
MNIFGGAGKGNPMIFHMAGNGPINLGGGGGSTNVNLGGGAGGSFSIGGVPIGVGSGGGIQIGAGGSGPLPSNAPFSVSQYKAQAVKYQKFPSPYGNMPGIGNFPSIGPGGGVVFSGFPGSVIQGIGSAAKSPANDINAAINAYNAYKAFKFGGAKGAVTGTGDVLMGVAPFTGPAAPFVMAAGAIATMVGSMMTDTKEQRANEINNLLGMSQYMHPATLALTTAAGTGNLVSENAYGAQDTGIAASSIRTSPSLIAVEGQAPWYSPNGKPSLGYFVPGVTANLANSGMFGTPPTGQAYNYAQIPGQVLYNQLPANNTPSPIQMNLNINAIDSQSILDRSPDIAAAVQKELMLGTGLGQSLQNAVFGPN